MSYGLIAVGVGMVVAAGITAYSSSQQSKAAADAAAAATQAQKEGMLTEWNMFQQSREDYAPWRDAGKKALGDVVPMIEAGPGKFVPEEQPGYKFGYENFVEKPYLSGQSAKGKRLSGETMKGLTKYASDYAETAYDNFLNRYYQKLNPYFSLAGTGQVATAGTVNAGATYANAISSGQQNIGNIQAQNALAQGQISSGSSMAYGNIAQSGMQNYMNYMMYKKMGAGGSGTSTSGGTGASSGYDYNYNMGGGV